MNAMPPKTPWIDPVPCKLQHHMPVNWLDEPRQPGARSIRVVCRGCGKFIGFKPITEGRK
jgi:hypothetical protein